MAVGNDRSDKEAQAFYDDLERVLVKHGFGNDDEPVVFSETVLMLVDLMIQAGYEPADVIQSFKEFTHTLEHDIFPDAG